MLPALNKKYPFYILSFGVLFLFLALRYDFGNDYMSYYGVHEALNAGWQLTLGNEEILYKYFNLLIPNFYVMVAILSFFYICTLFLLIKSTLYIRQYWFAVLILLINPYLFLVHLSSFRQTIALCFLVFAVHFLTKGKRLFYFLFISIAVGFHQSALVMFPVYFLLNQKKINAVKIVTIMGVVILLLITPLSDTLFKWILDFFPKGYSYYYEQGLQNSLRATLISSFYFFLIVLNINKLTGRELIYGKLALIATIISLLAYKASMINRIGMYFDIFLIVTIPLIFSKMKQGKVRLILFVAMFGIYILRYWSFFNNPVWIEFYGTYQTILNK
ncbi:EpsG family protein [Mesobacillus campisalis]|uniref:EpsG family protein n=1 Tax=Mesobacillus campisalis TaxID=1408103 RepID=UPI00138ED41A|nr:EpsG family protein [Mesobacillus campisalis]